jgi:hypothetical protein
LDDYEFFNTFFHAIFYINNMNKFLSSIVLLAATASFSFDDWFGLEIAPFVYTALDAGTETAGYWLFSDDHQQSGLSKTLLPTRLGNEYWEFGIEPVLEVCNGVCGTAVLDQGTSTATPFISVYINVAGETSTTDATPIAADASDWGGLCIIYKSEVAPILELGLNQNVEAAIGKAIPAKTLDKAPNVAKTQCIPWSEFEQPSWYKGEAKINGEQAAKQLVSINFKIQADPGRYRFNICAIGPYKHASSFNQDIDSYCQLPNDTSATATIYPVPQTTISIASTTHPIFHLEKNRNSLLVKSPTSSELKIFVFDVQGNLKKKYQGNTASNHYIPLDNLNQGAYLVKAIVGNSAQTFKIQVK